MDETYLIVGLGNPGSKYSGNRHNLGFLALDFIAEQQRTTFSVKSKLRSELAEYRSAAGRIILVKPLTFMNLSGQAVAAVAGFYKVPSSQIAVVYDDLDLDLSKLRIRIGGSAAGHNGIKSLKQHLADDFIRLRVGIGRPEHAGMAVASYVLQDFSSSEREAVDQLLPTIDDAVGSIGQYSLKTLQNKFN